jgi:hypothetical protein
LLEGGYRAFFQDKPHLCQPQGYVEMRNPEYRDQCKMAEKVAGLRKNGLSRSWPNLLEIDTNKTEIEPVDVSPRTSMATRLNNIHLTEPVSSKKERKQRAELTKYDLKGGLIPRSRSWDGRPFSFCLNLEHELANDPLFPDFESDLLKKSDSF